PSCGSPVRCWRVPAPTTCSARPARTGCAGCWRRGDELPRVRHRRLCRFRGRAGLGLHRRAPGHRPAVARRQAPGRTPRFARGGEHDGVATMNPTRRRRLWFVAAVLAASTAVAVLIAMALQHTVAYLYTPPEILDGRAGDAVASGQSQFRLGGMVADGS